MAVARPVESGRAEVKIMVRTVTVGLDGSPESRAAAVGHVAHAALHQVAAPVAVVAHR
ncbi:hypothetical protein [Streptomyces sp. NPDC086777]|uniref:hypothetical protein n=1 Tax=Streptomyces sp. NPDC086777 TaxID=3154866 RepID=UPI00344CD3C6